MTTPALSPSFALERGVTHDDDEVIVRVEVNRDGTLFIHENGASPEAVALVEAWARGLIDGGNLYGLLVATPLLSPPASGATPSEVSHV